jgi:nucleoside-diphosphate-sugar epimerase
MRVLVTGAGGFIGSWVLANLLADKHHVIAADRGADRQDRIVGRFPGVSAVSIDLSDGQRVASLLRDTQPEGLIHLAWYANPVDYLESHGNLAALAMTNTLVEASLAAGCRKIVIGGSCVEYDVHDRLLVENDRVAPRSLYAACKLAACQVANVMAREVGAELAWARIFHIHGPGEDPRRLIPYVASQLRKGLPVELTDGTQIRDQLHVSDVASGLIALLKPGASSVYNVCSGEPISLRQVLEAVADFCGDRTLLKFGVKPHRANETEFLAGDSRRLRSLGWSPRFGFRDGLRDSLRQYL